MKRQTDFSINEIIDLLKSEDEYYPSCLLINEVGIICSENKDEVSEKSLLAILEDENPIHRIISFCYLSTIPGMVSKHDAKLTEFRLRLENQPYLEEVDSEIQTELKRQIPPRFPMVGRRY